MSNCSTFRSAPALPRYSHVRTGEFADLSVSHKHPKEH